MTSFLRRVFDVEVNEQSRIAWVSGVLRSLPSGSRLLDAGAGEQRYRPYCAHLRYVSQDFCQYDGIGDREGLHSGTWNYGRIDLVCDIAAIPEPDASFDAILCAEVLEHVADPLKALDEFARLLRPGGTLIVTAPFASLVHFAPHFYATGFSRYWYERHLMTRGFEVQELSPNGDWFGFLQQEILRLPQMARRYYGPLGWLMYGPSAVMWLVLAMRRLLPSRGDATDVATFGFHCVAKRI